jgi:HAD superfamily hydrolase (TIGR01509 family)
VKIDARAGLFLDLDGTLADSLGVLRNVYVRFLDRFGKQANDDEFNRLNGPALSVVVNELRRAHDLHLGYYELMSVYVELIEKAYDEVQPAAGALELMRVAKSKDWRIAVVTSNQSALAQRWLNLVGLSPYVDLIISGEDVTRGKPDPEPYLNALTKVNCDANLSLAVEDTITGARAALGAGLQTCLINPTGSLQLAKSINIRNLHDVVQMLLGGAP